MKHRVIHPRELDASLTSAWQRIVIAQPTLASPYFQPGFSAAVGAVRGDARLTVIEDAGRVVGFFPFQRGHFGRGRPIGGPLSDHHGVIAPPELPIDPAELIRASGLSIWEFDHLPASQHAFAPMALARAASPIIDLREGYEAYAAERRAAGSEQIKKTGTLARKLEREHGPIEITLQATSAADLETLMRWKSEQCAATGSADVFGVPWTRRLMHDLIATQSPQFAGLFSTMHAKGTLIAAHMGMRSAGVWHYWFPSYDEAFAKYSPGLVLLLHMTTHAPPMGLTSIDLGKGDSFYKGRLASAEIPLLEGRVEVPSLANRVRALRRGADEWVDANPAARLVGAPLRALRRIERQRKYA